MAGNTSNISVRMDAEIKAQAEELFSELGLSFSTAVNVFVRQAVRQGGIPFKVSVGKKREEPVLEAMGKQPAQEENVKEYNNLEEFFAKLDAG